MDKFFIQESCDRCGGSLTGGRIMSMFNTDCICLDCKGVFGGVEVYWTAEGGLKQETDAGLKEISLEPQEVSAVTIVTDKLLRNDIYYNILGKA